MADILLMEGELNGGRVRVLKDDGCDMNFGSFDFVQDHRELFRIVKSSAMVRHTKKQYVNAEWELILERTVSIGTHTYVSRCVV